MSQFVNIADVIRMGLYDSRDGIMKAIDRGRLPRPVKIGNRLLWDRAELLEWINSKKVVIYRRKK